MKTTLTAAVLATALAMLAAPTATAGWERAPDGSSIVKPNPRPPQPPLAAVPVIEPAHPNRGPVVLQESKVSLSSQVEFGSEYLLIIPTPPVIQRAGKVSLSTSQTVDAASQSNQIPARKGIELDQPQPPMAILAISAPDGQSRDALPPRPWTITDTGLSMKIHDAEGRELAFVAYRAAPVGARHMTREQARAVAEAMVKEPAR